MAVQGFSASNYLSVADHADFDFPNGDWSEIIILRPDSVSGTFTPISNGTAYSANTRQWFMFDNSLTLVINGLDTSFVNLSSGTWYLVCAKRSGTTASIRYVPMGTTSVTAGSTFTLSAASTPSGANFLGRENDTTANPWNGAISDWLFVPGTAISDADLQDIATGTAIDSFGWYSSNAVFWAIPETTSNTDQIGGKTVTVNGTMTTETDPTDLERFGASELTAAGAGAASFASQLGGENYAAQYSSGNYHSIPDAAGMTLPNNDWTWLVTVRTGSNVTTGQDLIINGVYQAANVFDLYIASSTFGVDINNLGTDEFVSCSANTWYVVAVTRSSGTFTVRAIPFGSGTVSESSGTAISSAYDSSSGYHFGSDDAESFPLLGGAIGDALFVPGTAISDADLISIAQDNDALNSFSWYSSREFHLIAYLDTDDTGNHTVSETGTTTIIAGPSGFVREGGSADLTASGAGGFSGVGAATYSSALTAAGSGGFSGVGATTFESDLTAVGAGAFSGVGATIYSAEWTAAGAGAASFDGNSGFTELTAAGAGVGSFVGATTNETEWTAAGAGAFSGDATAVKQSDLSAAGAGAASFDGIEAHKTDLTAAGAGAASFEAQSDGLTELTAAGAGVGSFVGATLYAADLTATGAGAASFVRVTQAELTAAGAGSALFLTRTLEIPVTLPNSNIYFLAENLIDSADTSSATSTASGFSLSNVQLDTKSKVWRSTGTTAQVLDFEWTETQTISAVALAFTNLSVGSTVQIEIFTNAGDPSPVYDSGQLDITFAYDPPTGFDSIGLASFAFGGGTYFSHLFETQTGKEINITVTSPGNPDGYIEVSRVVCGLAYTPEIGASFGAQVGYQDSSTIATTDSGDTVVHRGSVKKSLSFNLETLNPVDKYGLSNVIKNRASSSPVFVSMFENSENPEERQSFMIYGLFDQSPATAISRHNIYNAGVSIKEI